ncbi:YesL family protein [Microbacterium sp. Sa4CUA7]|uniref:YesL family protein n=1 Tax=Microbacterium pullorum TaxID=2762236 RepID=A0ABR8RZ42_9MICO|nr:YesL family protein [Microbacterium pullorum]MBD7956491.1 YesL family protein [Microbacterium pullorum]
MFSVEGFMRVNTFLQGAYRLAYLNILWLATTVLGLVVFGIGPASYAVAAYVDRWFRFGETPPVTRTFIAHFREQYWRAAVVGWILVLAAAIAVTNVFTLTVWAVQFANVLALLVVAVAAAYVFPVMAATDLRGVGRPLAAALMIGFGSLPWTITAMAAVAAAVWLAASFALPLLVLFGYGIPAAAIGFVTRTVFTQLVGEAALTSPLGPRDDARPVPHPARGKR